MAAVIKIKDENDNWKSIPIVASTTASAVKMSDNTSVEDTIQSIKNSCATKQDTIADLPAIRSGAAAGATAVQPRAISDMETRTHAADTYVAKESGKGLSSNDYTTAEKNKLAGIEEDAQKNPTAVSQLENDAQYTTKTYVDNLFNSITHAEDYEY